MNNAIYISGYLNDNEMIELRDIEKNLLNNHTSLSVRNLKGCIMHSALDFADLELILFSYELFKHFILSGSYDVLKYYVVQIWEKIHKTEKVPFTIGVEDIPIGNAHENIKVKIDGKLTKKQKETVIDRTFDMLNRLIGLSKTARNDLQRYRQNYSYKNLVRFMKIFYHKKCFFTMRICTCLNI